MAITEKDKSDGLEIISVGLLYNGPWDKKYWSSSRGKDRYPYPVGYHAVRIHNGITYKMEILEDHKGPLFRITSTDGQSCSGQTPEIAWDNFQKMGNTRIKLWRGKRFSCKIDGVEFFGFKNQFVLRLLRELVTNVNGTAASSNSSEGTLETKLKSCRTEPCRHPNLLPYMEKPAVTGQSSRKRGVSSVKSTSSDTLKRIRPQDQRQSNDVSPPKSRSQKMNIHNDKSSASLSPSLDNNYGISNNSGIIEVSVTSKVVDEEKGYLHSVDSSEHCKQEVSHEDDGVLICSPNHAAITSATYKDSKPFDRSNDICTQLRDSSELKKEGKASFQNTSHTINDLELCAPDSLDLLDGTLNPKDVNNELTATCLFTSEDSVTDSHMEEDLVTSAAHVNTEKNDIEVDRQEITRSMMTVLLPRAVPLLKTFTRKKKKKSTNKNKKMNLSVDVASPVTLLTENTVGIKHQEEAHMLITDLRSLDSICGDIASVVPDSFDNNQSDKDADNHCLVVSDASQANLITFGQDTCITKTSGLPVRVDVLEDPAVSDITFRFCHEEHEALSKRLQRGNGSVSNSDNLVPLESVVNGTDAKRADDDTVNTSFTETPDISNLTRQCDIPLSESIICRSFRDMCDPETSAAASVTASDNYQLNLSHILSKQDCKYEEKLDGQLSSIHQEKSFLTAKAPICHVSTSQCQNFDLSASREGKSHDCGKKELPRHQDIVELDVSVPLLQDRGESFGNKMDENKIKRSGSYLTAQKNMKYNSNPADIFEIIGCYFHPKPISLVLLSTQADAIYICVLCCSFVDKKGALFIYRTEIQGERKGYPSFIGHASIASPVTGDAYGREMALDGSGLQFTPDGQYLVLLNCIKAPCCREGNISCPCPECRSASFEKNAVKIVQVKSGYMSVVATLKTADSVHCILVCEPNYLLAGGESTRLHLWVMNSTWSAEINESYLPSSDYTAPYIVELKKIPSCSNLVVGHNGFGGFGLWDIAKCILVSRFSAPSTSFCRFSPISLFTLQRKGIAVGFSAVKQISDIMDITTKFFVESANTHTCPVEGKDVAIPLLISNSDLHSHESSNFQVSTDGWRQALLVNNTMLLEDVLDLRAVAVGTLAGHGIIGTCDGHVYIWELSTGNILGNLHQFKGSAVSCIATDDSSSSAFAVAADCGLRLYLHSQQSCTNQQENKYTNHFTGYG